MSTSGQDRWLGPSDPWPRHGAPWFRDALNRARTAGWWFKKPGGSSHNFGIVYCERPSAGSRPCKYVVFSTGEGGESASQDLVRLMQRCPHKIGPDDDLTLASERIHRIERLISAATALLDQYDHEQEVLALLDRAEELVDLADEEFAHVFSSAVDKEAEAKAAGREADEQLASLETGVRDPAALVEIAEDTARQVHRTLRSMDPPGRARPAKERLSDARAKLQALRVRLSKR
jgi:hypothetical protein